MSMESSPSPVRRGTSNKNARGPSKQRKARRRWIMKVFASNVPGYVRCFRCGDLLLENEITVDRIVPGCLGGTYRRNNIRPACAYCNSVIGGGTRSK